jgi:uncharacterized phiE125 gp8 family phage protein
MFDLGDTVPLSVDVLDSDGAAAVAGSVALSVELPDGTTVTPTITNPTVGRYEVDYVPTVAGRYAVRWTSTVPATAHTDVFDVRPAAPRYMISLAQAKAHLNITSTSHDEELRGHIEAATAAIELYLNETVVRRTVVEKHTLPRPAASLVLDEHPVVALTSVESLDGATTWSGAALDVDGTTGVLRVTTGAALSGTVVITYVAGRSIVPANYSRAAELVVEQLYGPQRSAGAGPPGSPGGEEGMEPDDYGVVIPAAAINLLGVSAPLVG